MIISIEQGIAEVSALDQGIAEAAARSNDSRQDSIAKIGSHEIGSVHQRIRQVSTAEIRFGKGPLGEDRTVEVSVAEIRTSADGTGKRLSLIHI